MLIHPKIVGILNVTPDSFSDGGHYLDPEKALLRAQKLFADGADIIDIGAESTRPHATLIDPLTEWQRLQPVLAGLKHLWAKQTQRPLLSIDTRHAWIVAQALEYGIDWVNAVDQSQFKAMVPLLKQHHLHYVAMHNNSAVITGSAQALQGSILDALIDFKMLWQRRFVAAGLSLSQLILDPGIGFGKSPLQQLTILNNMQRLQSQDTPWLVGHSRKAFITKIWGASQDIDVKTAEISANLAAQQVAYLRVHEPKINLSFIHSTQTGAHHA